MYIIISRNIRKEIILKCLNYCINTMALFNSSHTSIKEKEKKNFLNNNHRNYILFVLDLSADHCAVFKLETNQLLYK